MPTIIVTDGYQVERGPHTPRHRSASKPRPILKTAANALKAVLATDSHDYHDHHRHSHTRARSSPDVRYVDIRRHEKRGKEHDHRGHRDKEARHHKAERHEHLEPSRHCVYRVEDTRRDERVGHKDEERRGHRRGATEYVLSHNAGGHLYYQGYPSGNVASPRKPRAQHRHEPNTDDLVRRFGGLQVTYAQSNRYYAQPAPSPSPAYYQQVPPPSPAYYQQARPPYYCVPSPFMPVTPSIFASAIPPHGWPAPVVYGGRRY